LLEQPDMLIRINHIHKNFGNELLLRDVSFQLNIGEKVGLVGRNGSGKTTLFRLIQGDLEADSGQLEKHPQVRIGLLQQIIQFDSKKSVFDEAISVFSPLRDLGREIETLEAEIESKSQHSELQFLLDHYAQLQTRWEMEGGYSYKSQTESILFGLGFDESELVRSTSELSGGELNRLNLAKLLLSKPNLLLLDEPTNHLDISAVEWLESFLKNYPHTFIVVSHDRYFLDATVSKILELAGGGIEEYVGNYSHYVEERERRLLHRQKTHAQQRELIQRTEDFIRRNIAGQKTKQAQARRKMLERLERVEPVQNTKSQLKFRFELNAQSARLVFKVTDLDIGYEELSLARQINLIVYRGDRVGIVGPNGSGKTTLLRTVLGLQSPLRGEVLVGHNVNVGYYAQTLSGLDSKVTVLEEMRTVSPLETDETLRGYLAKFLFRGEEVFQVVSSLSGGETSRLALAKLIFGKANTLVLDEPTNHLDIPSCEALEAALIAFPGTLLLVSHDRYLINRLVERIVYLDGNRNAFHFEGTYNQFETSREKGRKFESRRKERMLGEENLVPVGRLSKNQMTKMKSRCDFLEQEIQKLEEQVKQTSHSLNDPSIAGDYHLFKQLSDLYEDLISRLDQLYLEWESASANLEK
jgi:ATP-binding cassette subfamily F protein 3